MTSLLVRLSCVAAGGAIGSVLRYLLGGAIQQQASKSVLPWGTLVVNLSGCFVIGLLWELSEAVAISPNVRIFTFIGVLGGFTTFSSFALENRNLLSDGEFAYAAANVAISNIVGIALVFAGAVAMRVVLSWIRR